MPWKPRPDIIKLQQKNRELVLQLIRTREELQAAQHRHTGLQVLLDVRGQRIDALTVQVDRLQQEKKALDAEADHLAALFRETAVEPAPNK
jgi:uncharacterized protein YccT (UPF0319 family)